MSHILLSISAAYAMPAPPRFSPFSLIFLPPASRRRMAAFYFTASPSAAMMIAVISLFSPPKSRHASCQPPRFSLFSPMLPCHFRFATPMPFISRARFRCFDRHAAADVTVPPWSPAAAVCPCPLSCAWPPAVCRRSRCALYDAARRCCAAFAARCR